MAFGPRAASEKRSEWGETVATRIVGRARRMGRDGSMWQPIGRSVAVKISIVGSIEKRIV